MTSPSNAYALQFHPDAVKDWEAIDNSVRIQLEKKLLGRLAHPRVPADRLSGNLSSYYAIKNKVSGHRLIYEVIDEILVVLVIAVNKREDQKAYRDARKRR